MGSDAIGREFIKQLKPAPKDYDRLVDYDIRAFKVVERAQESTASKRAEAKA